MEFELYDKEELSVEPEGTKVIGKFSSWTNERIFEIKENNEDFIILITQDSKKEVIIPYDNVKGEKVEETKSEVEEIRDGGGTCNV